MKARRRLTVLTLTQLPQACASFWLSSKIPAQVITGSAEYVFVGNTDATDNLGNVGNVGNVGVLGSASLLANITDAVVQSDIQLGINGQVWQAIGTGDTSSNQFSGLYNRVYSRCAGNMTSLKWRLSLSTLREKIPD